MKSYLISLFIFASVPQLVMAACKPGQCGAWGQPAKPGQGGNVVQNSGSSGGYTPPRPLGASQREECQGSPQAPSEPRVLATTESADLELCDFRDTDHNVVDFIPTIIDRTRKLSPSLFFSILDVNGTNVKFRWPIEILYLDKNTTSCLKCITFRLTQK